MAERPETQTHGWVYAARLADDRIKIGISTDPEKRRRQIQNACGMRVEDFESFHVYAPGACERHLHKKYQIFRVEGEFFQGSGRFLFDSVVEYMAPRATPSPNHTRRPS